MMRLVRLKLAPHLSCAITTQWAAAAGKDGARPWAAASDPGRYLVPDVEWLVGCASQCVVHVEM